MTCDPAAPKWTVIHGRNEDILPTMADGSVDHVITDPPYTKHIQTNMMSATTNMAIKVRKIECNF